MHACMHAWVAVAGRGNSQLTTHRPRRNGMQQRGACRMRIRATLHAGLPTCTRQQHKKHATCPLRFLQRTSTPQQHVCFLSRSNVHAAQEHHAYVPKTKVTCHVHSVHLAPPAIQPCASPSSFVRATAIDAAGAASSHRLPPKHPCRPPSAAPACPTSASRPRPAPTRPQGPPLLPGCIAKAAPLPAAWRYSDYSDVTAL